MLRKCFEGVHRDGELIRVRDTVLLKSGPRKKSLPYVAKVSALWEEPESGSMLAVRSIYSDHTRRRIYVLITGLRSEVKDVLCFTFFLSFRRADDEFVLVLPSRTHTGRTQPQRTL